MGPFPALPISEERERTYPKLWTYRDLMHHRLHPAPTLLANPVLYATYGSGKYAVVEYLKSKLDTGEVNCKCI